MPYGPAPRRHSDTAQSLLIGLGAFIIAVIVFVAVSVIAHTDQGTRTVASGNSQANGNAQGNGNTGASGNNAPVGTQTAQVGSAITLAGLSAGEQVSR
ncbi:MAG TPA: hypothetical protein VME70_07060 [Mycobacteriales bacterium]|nr:hypothetical protein [Mycobacteriales bacterium]